MLEKDPEKRIAIEKVKQHPFFADLKWEDVAQKKLKPPIDVSQIMLKDAEDEEAFFSVIKVSLIKLVIWKSPSNG